MSKDDPLSECVFYVYFLQSFKDKKAYVGYTYELGQRFEKHNKGLVKSTKHRRPLKLLFTKNFLTELEAKKRELWWKSGAGRRRLKEFLISQGNAFPGLVFCY